MQLKKEIFRLLNFMNDERVFKKINYLFYIILVLFLLIRSSSKYIDWDINVVWFVVWSLIILVTMITILFIYLFID